jgi:hypothetical protein
MHRGDLQVRLPPTEPHGLGILWAILSNSKIARRNRRGSGQNFAVRAMVNGPVPANALKTFAPCKAAAPRLRLSRHTQP